MGKGWVGGRPAPVFIRFPHTYRTTPTRREFALAPSLSVRGAVMQLGFVSAILGDLSLEQVLAFARDEGFACVELMCWPPGGADRRYAGVTHLDVTHFTDDDAGRLREMLGQYGVAVSGLGYYPNPLDPDPEHRRVVAEHLKRVMTAASRLGVGVVNTFIGRDPTRSVEANWPMVRAVWPDLLRQAEESHVRIGIENCPMLFSKDEWPGGKNLATTPDIWRALFEALPSANLGLNFDPSHLVWQHIDYMRCVRRVRPAHHPLPRQGYAHRRRPVVRGGEPGAGLAHGETAGPGRRTMGTAILCIDRRRLSGGGVHRGGGQGFRGVAGRPAGALRQSKRYLGQFMTD